jgi:hypothetical protein
MLSRMPTNSATLRLIKSSRDRPVCGAGRHDENMSLSAARPITRINLLVARERTAVKKIQRFAFRHLLIGV